MNQCMMRRIDQIRKSICAFSEHENQFLVYELIETNCFQLICRGSYAFVWDNRQPIVEIWNQDKLKIMAWQKSLIIIIE